MIVTISGKQYDSNAPEYEYGLLICCPMCLSDDVTEGVIHAVYHCRACGWTEDDPLVLPAREDGTPDVGAIRRAA